MAWYKETLDSSTVLVMERPKTRPMRPELLIDFRTLSEQKIALIQIMTAPR
jgi:hypothetical protein